MLLHHVFLFYNKPGEKNSTNIKIFLFYHVCHACTRNLEKVHFPAYLFYAFYDILGYRNSDIG